MKKLFAIIVLAACACFYSAAWGVLGHKTVIAVAERHLTQKTKANIAKYFDYDLKKDAVWMDHHRRDPEIAYTTAWHVYNVDSLHRYDPNPRLKTGDAIHALEIVDYNLGHYKELSDSAVVMIFSEAPCPTGSGPMPTPTILQRSWTTAAPAAGTKLPKVP